jgi:hypothetical protein
MGVQRQLKVLGIFARLCSSRRQGRPTSTTCRACCAISRRVRALRRAASRSAACWMSCHAPRRAARKRVAMTGRHDPIGAMILAAGRGERMRPLSEPTPSRCSRREASRSSSGRFEALARAGFRDIVVNVAHRRQQFVAALGDGAAFGVTLSWSVEPDRSRSRAASPRRCRSAAGPPYS